MVRRTCRKAARLEAKRERFGSPCPAGDGPSKPATPTNDQQAQPQTPEHLLSYYPYQWSPEEDVNFTDPDATMPDFLSPRMNNSKKLPSSLLELCPTPKGEDACGVEEPLQQESALEVPPGEVHGASSKLFSGVNTHKKTPDLPEGRNASSPTCAASESHTLCPSPASDLASDTTAQHWRPAHKKSDQQLQHDSRCSGLDQPETNSSARQETGRERNCLEELKLVIGRDFVIKKWSAKLGRAQENPASYDAVNAKSPSSKQPPTTCLPNNDPLTVCAENNQQPLTSTEEQQLPIVSSTQQQSVLDTIPVHSHVQLPYNFPTSQHKLSLIRSMKEKRMLHPDSFLNIFYLKQLMDNFLSADERLELALDKAGLLQSMYGHHSVHTGNAKIASSDQFTLKGCKRDTTLCEDHLGGIKKVCHSKPTLHAVQKRQGRKRSRLLHMVTGNTLEQAVSNAVHLSGHQRMGLEEHGFPCCRSLSRHLFCAVLDKQAIDQSFDVCP